MAESKDELKNLLMKVQEESEKADLKLSIQKMKIMESSSITSWPIDEEYVEIELHFTFLGSRILVFGRLAITNLDSVLKSRDITLLTKVCIVKAMVFPAVMYGCKSWTIKKAEHQIIDAFELWC